MTHKGYNARFWYDDEDRIYAGQIAGIRDIVGFHAENLNELEAAFHEAVEDYIETCAEMGKPPPEPWPGDIHGLSPVPY
ncbi:MAG: type II toxin-antitoxin system HicB family antitoxin [Rhodobacteraceae bacterium]|nr:type II toxin-antitoxin system HicB family antitoxin [Paracoccaceae bacterium]